MSYGDIPDHANDYTASNLLMPHGAVIDGNLKEVHPIDLRDPNEIQEFVPHSWYKYADEKKGLHPWDGVTEASFKLGPNAKGTKTLSRKSTRARNTPGSRRPAGRATRWRLGRSPATSSAMHPAIRR